MHHFLTGTQYAGHGGDADIYHNAVHRCQENTVNYLFVELLKHLLILGDLIFGFGQFNAGAFEKMVLPLVFRLCLIQCALDVNHFGVIRIAGFHQVAYPL